MTTELAQKLEGVRDFRKILETVVKEIGETYSSDVSQIVLSNPLDRNITSICEYKLYPEAAAEQMPVHMAFPLPIEGLGLGAVTLARRNEFHENEINWIRITLAELSDVIRHAQINDIVQRDTFRNTFLAEIQNVMQYSLGLGDALFMVVNILGKVLNASRCLFVCVDDSNAGWKAYEFWQREKLPSCQEYGWPTTDSPIVARALLTTEPLIIYEANENSYLTPAQEELQLLNVRSLLGVPLKSESAVHGCIILQHCERRHAFTRSEIDMVQNVADAVAEALAKLPEEKKAHEPIMRLHQREVSAAPGSESKESILAVRRALRGALGNTSIPSAQKSAPPKPAVPAAAPPSPPVAAPATPTTASTEAPEKADKTADLFGASELGDSKEMQRAPWGETPATADATKPTVPPQPVLEGADAAKGTKGSAAPDAVSDASALADLGNSILEAAKTESSGEEVSSSLHSLLGGMGVAPKPSSVTSGSEDVPAQASTKSGDVDAAASSTGESAAKADGGNKWGDLDSIPTPGAGTPSSTTPASAESKKNELDAIATPAAASTDAAAPKAESKWGDLDAIAAPSNGAAAANAGSKDWGSLDSIPTPSAPPARGGLGGSLGKRASSNPASPLLASLHRDKSKFQPQPVAYVDGGAIEIDEKQAEEKIKQALSTANPTSDFIFSLPNMDPRMLGRIDGWVSQVESKDKYLAPHAMQVAEFSVAIARLLGLPQAEVDAIRLAAVVHDVGKLGLPGPVLQKAEAALSDQELLMIMKHPIDGANLLEGFTELAAVAPVVLAHHEEYDGNGYPAGLAADQIPAGARIIHVASDYQAMVGGTKTRPPMPPQDAQQALRASAGKTYDPGMVEALIACVQQGMMAAGLSK